MIGGKLPPLPKKKAVPDADRAGRESGLFALAESAAQRHGLPPALVHAVILAESRYDPSALSHKGAMGLMQLMPGTAQRFGVADAWNPSHNIEGGVRYLRALLRRFQSVELALAAYNAGEQAVARYGNSVPPYEETMTYVERVQAFYGKLQAGSSIDSLIKRGVPGIGGRTRLSGWGVIFGAFPQKARARGLLKQQQAALRGVLRGGRPAVVRRSREGGPHYTALLVGLKREDAVTACRHLWNGGGYCKALSPRELKDPKAIWR